MRFFPINAFIGGAVVAQDADTPTQGREYCLNNSKFGRIPIGMKVPFAGFPNQQNVSFPILHYMPFLMSFPPSVPFTTGSQWYGFPNGFMAGAGPGSFPLNAYAILPGFNI